METQPTINFAGPDSQTGFRLERLEVLNWGTFNGSVHVLRLAGLTALLTGPNGSGKSTLVDALLTLLVPQKMGRNYNMASGAAKKKERTERTYVQGVWAEGLISSDAPAVEAKKLRPDPGTPSVLLAVFHNRATAQFVTLAQVLWLSGDEVHHVFVVTADERSIVRDFHSLGDTRKLRQTLASRGMEPLPSFDAYAETFCRRVHLSYPAGLSLFNTVVSIKETGDIAQFIRDHMLSRLETIDTSLADAHTQLEDLERCDREIETAKRQLELLRPVATRHEEVRTARAVQRTVQGLQDGLPFYFASIVVRQAGARIAELDSEEAAIRTTVGQLESRRGTLIANRDQAITALAGLPESHLMEGLNTRLKSAKQRKELKEAARARFDQAMRTADLKELVRSEDHFKALRDKVTSKRAASRGAYEEAIRKEGDLRRQAEEKRKEQREKLLQIKELTNNRTHIRGDLPRIRDGIVKATGIPIVRLPFGGELVEVRADRTDWRPVIEILLRGFGRSMLVQEQDYRAVVDYLFRNRIFGLLNFNRVTAMPPSLGDPKAGDFDRVISVLNVRPDHPLRGWVADEIRRRFPHVCCKDQDEFRKNDWAISTELLIRNGPSRHRKDDRPHSIDPEEFALGWNNEELLRTLAERAHAAGEQAKGLDEQAHRAAQSKTDSSRAGEAYDLILGFSGFEQISAEAELKEIRDIEDMRIKLEAKSDRLRSLNSAKEAAEANIREVEGKMKTAENRLATLGEERKSILRDLARREEQLKTVPTGFDYEDFADKVRPHLGKKTAGLSNAAELEAEVSSTLVGVMRRTQDNADRVARQLTQAMADFLIAFPEFKTDFSAKEEKAADYLVLMKRIDEEKLPELQERFRRLMNERVVQDIALLQSKMEESVRDYQSAIVGLNGSLREIDYNRGTYIQIVSLPTKAAVISQFKGDLKACLPGAVNPTDETRQRAFQKIRSVLTRLREDDRWRQYVTDTRNWLDFRADEINRETKVVVNNYSSSAARSGGQKAKLAFTVMASAIAHQYGLLRTNAEAKSFRFVVIDEIFGKTDETNSVYALQLFQKFKLQLLVVCPFTAQARVVDGFVGSYHLTSNPDWSNSTLVSATLEQINEARTVEPTAAIQS